MQITDVVSDQLAELQLTLGEGPSLEAAASGGPVLASDLGTAETGHRWPAFTPAARQAGAEAAAGGLADGQEHRQGHANDADRRPRGPGHVLVNPHPAQDQAEDQLGDQQRLDHRHRAVVQGQGLEDE